MAFWNFSSLLGSGLGGEAPAAATYAAGTRSVMVFTSRLRQHRFAYTPPVVEAASVPRSAPGDFGTSPQIGYAAGLTRGDVTQADGFYKSTTGLMDFIVMNINPNMVRFKQPKRFTKKDTREGSVFFHFLNSRGQNNDILTIEFVGNTGNIDQRASIPEEQPNDANDPLTLEQDGGGLRAILCWHNLYLITREPLVLNDGSENEFTITYVSPLFPQSIDFTGFYNQVLEFEEDAKKPHSRNYRFEFTVQDVNPPLDEILSWVALSANVGGPGGGLVLP